MGIDKNINDNNRKLLVELDKLNKEKLKIESDIDILNKKIESYSFNDNDLKQFDKLFIELASKYKSNNNSISSEDANNIIMSLGFDKEYILNNYDKYTEYRKKINELKDLKISKDKYNDLCDNVILDLISNNIQLVNYCIRYFFPNSIRNNEDINSMGVFGLLKAIKTFDVNKTYIDENGKTNYIEFSTYALPIIRSTIQLSFRNIYGISYDNYMFKKRIEKKLENSEEISSNDMKKYKLVSNLNHRYDDIAFKNAKDNNYDILEMSDSDKYLTNEQVEKYDSYEDTIYSFLATDYEMDDKSLKQAIDNILLSISSRDAEIVKMYFGLNGYEKHTLREIAPKFNLNYRTVHEIINKSLRKFKHPINSREIKDYVGINYTDEPTNVINKEDLAYIKLIDLENLDMDLETKLKFVNFTGINWNLNDMKNAFIKLGEVKNYIMTSDEKPKYIDIVTIFGRIISDELYYKCIEKYRKTDERNRVIKK